MAENTGKRARFKRDCTDSDTNTPIPAGAALEIIGFRVNEVEGTTGEIPIWVPRDVVEVK